jgi:hypothetical protein
MSDNAALVNVEHAKRGEWRPTEVTSPHLAHPVPVVAAEGIPYITNANRLQNLSIYLPRTPETSNLIGTPASSLPGSGSEPGLTRYHVHIHGGAWRDPELTSASIEPAVAHAFSASDVSAPVSAVASINYTVSPFNYTAPPVMAHPPIRYDPNKDNHSDPAREAIHPPACKRRSARPRPAPLLRPHRPVLRPLGPQLRRVHRVPGHPSAPAVLRVRSDARRALPGRARRPQWPV